MGDKPTNGANETDIHHGNATRSIGTPGAGDALGEGATGAETVDATGAEAAGKTSAAEAGIESSEAKAKAKQERSRLIDHFKRVYQIVVGLAITEAVRRLSQSFAFPPNTAVLMFATFLITVIPIFHGGDRSLDLKYLDETPKTFRERASYLWDVYMLVITATLFVGIAEQIPQEKFTTATVAAPFYRAMAAMFLFDSAVLVIDWMKTPGSKRGRLQPYVVWTIANLAIGVACALIGFKAIAHDGALATFGLFGYELDLRIVAPAIFLAACVRTFADYVAGSDKNFMFP